MEFKYRSGQYRNRLHMDKELSQQFETKLELIIELLRDKSLMAEDIAVIKETDEIVKSRNLKELVRL